MYTPATLPVPGRDELELSAELTRRIRADIDAHGGAIPFRRFMELALYAPGLGYYMNALRKFGSAGDFITAPEISPLFAHCLARQCAQVFAHCAAPVVLEAGAGTGALAAEMLLELERLHALPRHYAILDVSGTLRRMQHDTLRARAPHLLERVAWLDTLPATPFEGVVLANELLDALPVHRVRVTHDGVAERFVAWSGDRFVWTTAALSDPDLAERVTVLAGLPEGYETEIGLDAERWLATLAPLLARGALLLIDYGFPEREYYHPQRTGGTLMCHYRHRAHPDALLHPGLQDITAHVNFTALAHTAHAAGLRVAGFTTQAYFLLGLGIERALHDARGDRERWALSQQIQRLTSPAEMGELFKVLALTRGVEQELEGFSFVDQRMRL